MQLRTLAILTIFVGYAPMTYAAGDANAGRDLVTRSCSSCHAMNSATIATDGVPPLLVLARDNKERPAWIRGWLMDPHPPMPSISLSRQQIDNIIAYLNTLPTD